MGEPAGRGKTCFTSAEQCLSGAAEAALDAGRVDEDDQLEGGVSSEVAEDAPVCSRPRPVADLFGGTRANATQDRVQVLLLCPADHALELRLGDADAS